MSNEELAKKIQAGEQDKLLELWQQVQRFAYQQARRWVGYGGLELEDLLQSAFLALLDAINRWDEERGAFLTCYGLLLKASFARATGQRTKRERMDPLQNCTSLSEPLTDSEGVTLEDTLADPAAEEAVVSVEERDLAEKRREVVRAALSKLTKRELSVVRARYWYGLTVEQTARRMGVSKNAIYFAEKKALMRLRHPAVSRAFLPVTEM